MSESPPARAKLSPITWVGLFIALFGMLLVRQVVYQIWPSPTLTSAITKEAGMWLIAATLLVIIKIGEGLPLSSVRLGTVRWGKSILWGLLIAVVCLRPFTSGVAISPPT